MTTRKLLLVFAHPDDETFATGGTAALATRRGFEVYSVCATRGEEGAIAREAQGVSRAELPGVRERELREAASILGIREVACLDYRDGLLKSIPAKEGRDKVAERMRAARPHVTITFSPQDGITGHWDHRTIGQWTTDAFHEVSAQGMLPENARLYWVAIPREMMPADMPMMENDVPRGMPLADISTRIDIREVAEKKRAALLRHVTQRADVERFLTGVPAALSTEYLRRVAPSWSSGEAFEGWPWE
ncbi:MAG: PIG-L family deacetylase [Candidatus Terrybacteria bacterium]|nr:PIG-L family deacetylase [Candidatus Terrybacteria bacterium]